MEKKVNAFTELGFAYTIVWRRRGSGAIYVMPNGEVRVIVPNRCSQKRANSLVAGHAGWVRRKLREGQDRRKQAVFREYASGDRVLLQGRWSVLRVSHGTASGVSRRGSTLHVNVPLVFDLEGRRRAVRKALLGWYIDEATSVLQQRVAFYSARIGVMPTGLKVKDYRSEWGNCTPRGIVQFNWRLAMAPLSILDYVVVHELCHMLHPNHSKTFWKSVQTVVPDYAKRRKWLRGHQEELDLE